MGYTYSKVLDKKIRIFEEGTRMLSAIDPQTTMAAFAVFPPDSSKVELFLPEETVVLEKRVRPNSTSVWNIEDDDTYMLEKCYDEWLVTRRGKVLFSSTGFENIHKAMFVNDKGEKLSAAFSPRQVWHKSIMQGLTMYFTNILPHPVTDIKTRLPTSEEKVRI